MEIERKFLIKDLPKDLTSYPCSQIEQAYLNENPVLRIRRKDDDYILTYKSKGMMAREESEFPLTKEAYEHLRTKADGKIISKTRYFIPLAPHTIELDVFHGDMEPLIMAEVEFASEEDAVAFTPPEWCARDVTWSGEYQNSRLAMEKG